MKSAVAYIIAAAVILYASLFFCPRWERSGSESTLGWDVSGYYWYLPSVFIYHDLKEQRFADSVLQKYQFTPDFQQGSRLENGAVVLTYSSGMALLYAPFFAAGHLAAKLLGYPADGFSIPYRAAISFGSLLVCLVGLWYFRRLLRYYFSDGVTAIMILLLVIGTNYLNYSAIDGALTHNWLFTLYVFLLLATRAFYKTYKTRYAVAIECLCGLDMLVRPSELVSVLIPLLWGMERINPSEIKERLLLFKRHFRQILVAMLCLIAVGSIQLFYWKHVSGHWLVYSYGDKSFSWKHPHWFDYSLSYRSGWLTYTPLMLLSFIGIIPFLKYGKNKVAVLTFFAINFYIVCAWDIWWYGGTGGRAMIQSYPVILFPVATLIDYLSKHRIWLSFFAPFILLTAYFNVWFTVQAHGGAHLYDPEGMTKAYFWKVAGRWHVPDEVKKLKDTDELLEGTPNGSQLIYTNNLETDTTLSSRADAIEGHKSIYLDKQHQWSNTYSFPLPSNNAAWLRAQATFHIDEKEWTGWKMTQFIVRLSSKGRVVKERMIRVQRFLERGDTRDIFIDLKLPMQRVDSCHIQFWNPESKEAILIDKINVWTFKAS